jgi:hypothetical protein
MIDHLIRFADEEQAKADPVVGAYWREARDGYGAWDGACCFPGQRVWKPAENVVSQVTMPPNMGGATMEISTPQYLPYWYITISAVAVVPALRDHPTCMVVWSRTTNTQIYSKLTPELLAEYTISPVPAGSTYPFGG